MEEKWNSRTELLIGKEGIEKLQNAKVAIYGVGGVGSFVAEGLARSGIGNMVLIDNDVVSISNLNRQIHANIETIGKKKVEVMKERILKINPNAKINTYMADEIENGENRCRIDFPGTWKRIQIRNCLKWSYDTIVLQQDRRILVLVRLSKFLPAAFFLKDCFHICFPFGYHPSVKVKCFLRL